MQQKKQVTKNKYVRMVWAYIFGGLALHVGSAYYFINIKSSLTAAYLMAAGLCIVGAGFGFANAKSYEIID